MNYNVLEVLIKLSELGVSIFKKDGALKVSDPDKKLNEADKGLLKESKESILSFFSENEIESNGQLGFLSFQQQRLWLIDKIEPGNYQYNMPGVLSFDGDLKEDALEAAFDTVIARHDILRSVYRDMEDNPYQLIRLRNQNSVLTKVDISAYVGAEQEEKLELIAKEQAELVFDLANDVPMRMALVKLSDSKHRLFVTMHHIAFDAWSVEVMVKEFVDYYTQLVSGAEEVTSQPLEIQYIDYAHWQREWLQGDNLDTQLEYWKERLAGAPQVHELPLDKARGPMQSYEANHLWLRLEQPLQNKLNTFAQQQDVTLFMILQAAFATFVGRYSGKKDIVMGTPMANRQRAELAELIGFFANTLVLRTDINADPSFADLVKSSKQELLNAYEYQQLPFEKLVDELQPERNLSYSPLFQIMFILQSHKRAAFNLPGLEPCYPEAGNNAAKFDLTLEVVEDDDGLQLHWEYAANLFHSETIERMAASFLTLVNAGLDKPETPVSLLPLLSEVERNTILSKWNNTRAEYPSGQCMHELFEAKVAASPDATAVVFAGQSLSYAELNSRSNRLANFLREQGVKPGSLVGLNQERSLNMIIGLLAIFKAGGAYVPLDPSYPVARLNYMLENSDLNIVLTQQHLQDRLATDGIQMVCLDEAGFNDSLQSYSADNPLRAETGLKNDDLAYIIYTSGSTGKPKGVMIEHRTLTNFLCSMQSEPGMETGDRLLAVTSTSFDIHTLELYLPLITGACLFIAADDDTVSPAKLAEIIKQNEINVMQATPSTWKMLLAEGWLADNPLKVLCGGEALSRKLKDQLVQQPNIELWNMYGPTETTVWSSVKRLDSLEKDVTLGPPIANTQLYVLDEKLQVCPVGVPGELYIGGDGLSRGYLNRDELTAERFVENPFAENDAKMYRTGDLVSWLPDGDLQFIGRVDFQVKIRGFRIELEEIESVLMTHESVKDAVVTARDAADGEPQLIAYIVSDLESSSATNDALATHLRDKLPDYMVPAVFMILPSFPLTPNGKVDRKALPDPDLSELMSEYIAPQNETQQQLCGIWQTLLSLEKVGARDNFFRIGGHSLLAMRLVSEIRKQWQIDLPIASVFEFPDITSLANLIEQECVAQEGKAGAEQRIQKRKNLSEILEEEGEEL